MIFKWTQLFTFKVCMCCRSARMNVSILLKVFVSSSHLPGVPPLLLHALIKRLLFFCFRLQPYSRIFWSSSSVDFCASASFMCDVTVLWGGFVSRTYVYDESATLWILTCCNCDGYCALVWVSGLHCLKVLPFVSVAHSSETSLAPCGYVNISTKNNVCLTCIRV